MNETQQTICQLIHFPFSGERFSKPCIDHRYDTANPLIRLQLAGFSLTRSCRKAREFLSALIGCPVGKNGTEASIRVERNLNPTTTSTKHYHPQQMFAPIILHVCIIYESWMLMTTRIDTAFARISSVTVLHGATAYRRCFNAGRLSIEYSRISLCVCIYMWRRTPWKSGHLTGNLADLQYCILDRISDSSID